MMSITAHELHILWSWVIMGGAVAIIILILCVAWAVVYHHISWRKYWCSTENEE